MRPFGQHFLTDEKAVHCLIEQLLDEKNRTIIEIGPGKGFITKFLLQNGFKIVAYEIDEKIANQLKESVNSINLDIRVKDFLKVDIQELPDLSCCIGSIPYQISSKLVRKIIDLSFKKAVLIVQKEFAEKLTASPSTRKYTFISALAQSFYTIRRICNIPKSSFSPPPKVESTIIVMVKKQKTPEPGGYALFLRRLFTSPNKTVRYALRSLQDVRAEILQKRVRDLSTDEILEIYSKSARKLV